MKVKSKVRLFVISWLIATYMAGAEPGATFSSSASIRFVGVAGESKKRTVYQVNEKVTLVFRVTGDFAGVTEAKCRVEVRDHGDRNVTVSSVSTGTDGDDLLINVVPDTTQSGWYFVRIDLESNGRKLTLRREEGPEPGRNRDTIASFAYPMFAVVPEITASMGSRAIAVDAAFAEEGAPIGIAEQMDLARLAGATWVRDRLSWPACEPSEGKFDFHAVKVRAETLRNKGLKTLQTFHGVPNWSKADASESFPDDLRAAYRFAEAAARALGSDVEAWEIWNEPDIAHFCKEPPDAYAALVKAMALGFRAGDPSIRILLGPFARNPTVGNYSSVLFANGVEDFVDHYSFHTYFPVKGGQFGKALATHLEVARDARLRERDVWLTETSLAFRPNMAPADINSMTAQVEQLFGVVTACLPKGVRPIFWFLLRPYFGANVQFGMISPEGEPFPIFPALAVMNHELGQARFMLSKQIDGAPSFIFDSGNDEVAVVMSDLPETPVPQGDRDCRYTGALGESLLAHQVAGRAVIRNRGLPFYRHRTLEHRAHGGSHQHADRRIHATSGIVLKVKYPREFLKLETSRAEANWDGVASNWAPRGYRCAGGASINAMVEIYNFSETKAAGILRPILPDSIRIVPEEVPFVVAPGDRIAVKFMIATDERLPAVSAWAYEAQRTDGMMIDKAVTQWFREDPK